MKSQDWFFFTAWSISVAGFCLSVLYGEILQYPPCPLCWYQRIALFPLVFLLGAAFYRGHREMVLYALPLALLGLLAALFQIAKDHLPFFKTSLCTLGTTCADPVFTFFGFLSFPALSAVGFSCIVLLLGWSHFSYKKNS